MVEAEEETVPEFTAEIVAEEAEVTLEAPQVADFTFDTEAEFVIQKGEDTEAEIEVGDSTNFLLLS